MTFQEAITNARSELGDTYEGSYTYEDADMLRYAVEGVREAWGSRPSLKYDESTGVLYDNATVIATSASETFYDIPLPDGIQSGIIYYIIYGCLSRDITDENNAKSSVVAKERFRNIIMG